MNIFEKLESFQQKLVGFELYGFATDLQNIIEEYKNAQEPFGYVGEITFNGARSGTVNRNKTVHFKYPLFTHPPLSDETVKDAEIDKLKNVQDMHLELIMSVASKFPNETRHETALRYIRRAEEGSNNQPQAMKADK